MSKKLATFACLAALTAVASPAAALVVGNADSGNCYPFSCGASDTA